MPSDAADPTRPTIYGEPSLLDTEPKTVWVEGAPAPDAILPIAERLHVDERYAGRGVTAAFLDAGFYAHPDLTQPRNRIYCYHDLLAGRSGIERIQTPDPSMWHGMMTSTVAAGNGHLSEGRFRSLAPEMDLVLVKIGRMARIRHGDIARGLQWVLRHKDDYGIRVVNISAGGDWDASYLHDPVCEAAEACVRAGVVVVCAVGNAAGGKNRVIPPANAPSVITVGGLNDHGDPSLGRLGTYWSCYGPTLDGLQKPEIIAPAIWVVAPILPETPTALQAELLQRLADAPDAELTGLVLENRGVIPALDEAPLDQPYMVRQLVDAQVRDQKVISGYYKHVDGTSFAAPIVTSIVAQMLEANPGLKPHEVKRILIDTARRLPGVAVERQGWGLVQPAAALRQAERARG